MVGISQYESIFSAYVYSFSLVSPSDDLDAALKLFFYVCGVATVVVGCSIHKCLPAACVVRSSRCKVRKEHKQRDRL